GGVGGGFAAGEGKISLAEAVERREWVRPAVVPGAHECGRELLEAAQCHARKQFVPVAEVAIGRGRADARPTRGLCEGEACRAFLGDQFERGAQQRFLEVAMVVAALPSPAALPIVPAHVKIVYIERRESSIAGAVCDYR